MISASFTSDGGRFFHVQALERLCEALDGEGGRFPKWMWGNQCMAEFFDWCKDGIDAARRPELFGIDWYSLFESKRAVSAFLERLDPAFAAEFKNRLAFLDKFSDAHEYGRAMVHGTLARLSGPLPACLPAPLPLPGPPVPLRRSLRPPPPARDREPRWTESSLG